VAAERVKANRMTPWLREILLRGAALAGLGASVLLLAEYRQPGPVICEPGGGCEIVRQSAFATPLGVPLPYLGVTYFAAVLAAALVPAARRWLVWSTAAGAVGAAAFIAIQALVLHAFCPWCIVVDVAALLIAGTVLTSRHVVPPAPRLAGVGVSVGAAVLVSLGAVLWHGALAARAPRADTGTATNVPAVVRAEQKPSGVTIVEFVDFECPACRVQHSRLRGVLGAYEGSVNVVLKHLPLPQHEHAVAAARAFCCAEELGVAKAMADRLFGAGSLRPQDCEEIAVSLGLDRDEFRRCVSSERVAKRLQADKAAAAAAGIRGLPTLWIGTERFEGVQSDVAMRASIDRALREARS